MPTANEMSATPATLYEPGHVVAGKYVLEAQLGQGGMGVVWRARNIALDSPVAIKVGRASGDQALLRGRLMQEARADAKLTHPAIVQVGPSAQAADAGTGADAVEGAPGQARPAPQAASRNTSARNISCR